MQEYIYYIIFYGGKVNVKKTKREQSKIRGEKQSKGKSKFKAKSAKL